MPDLRLHHLFSSEKKYIPVQRVHQVHQGLRHFEPEQDLQPSFNFSSKASLGISKRKNMVSFLEN